MVLLWAPADPCDHAALVVSHRGDGSDLSGRVCAKEQMDRPDRGQHQQPAAVPSIVFGLLGLAMFLNFSLPRSAPLVGGMVLAMMTLPTIIIASALP